MEKFSNNPLEDWINNDSELRQLLDSIDLEGSTDKERAKLAFDKLSEKYNLPKFPDDVGSRELKQVKDFHLYYPVSMYEVLGQLKFAENSSTEIKSNVLFSAYLVKNKYQPNIDEALTNYLDTGELAGFGYKGENIDVEMIPVKKGESWYDLGCKYFIKELD